MAAYKTWKSLAHFFIKENTFFKTGYFRKSIFNSLKSPQRLERTISSIGDRYTNFSPCLSSVLAGRSYKELYDLSVKDPDVFWGSIAKERLTWIKPVYSVKDCEITNAQTNWFVGGKLNVSGKTFSFYSSTFYCHSHDFPTLFNM